MATYNGGRFVREQLASIARQTRLPDVLIISDDGSQDDTWEIVSRFAESARFHTRVVRGPGKGLAWNFWTAARLVDAELIAWADQDDIWHPAKLERCETALQDPYVDFVSHSALTVDDQGQSLRRHYPRYRTTRTLGPLQGDPWHVPSGFASVFRGSLLRCADFEGRPRSHQTGRAMNHDHVVSLTAFAHGGRRELPDVLAKYRQHSNNSAGDPTRTGTAAVHEALRPQAPEFATLAAIAREQGDWLFAGTDDPAVVAYFGRLERICRVRSQIFEPESAARRLRRVARAERGHVYASRTRGGFGLRALARDAGLALVSSMIR
jgi:glycosyltransferase involved in cell wall biosynthesis